MKQRLGSFFSPLFIRDDKHPCFSLSLEWISFLSFVFLILTVSSPLILYSWLSLIPAFFAITLTISSCLHQVLFSKVYIDKCIGMYIAFLFIAIFGTLICSHNFSYLKTTVNVFIMFFGLIEYFVAHKSHYQFVLLYVLSVFVLSLLYLVYYFPRIIESLSRISSVRFGDEFDNTNSLAFTFLSGIVCCSFLLINTQLRNRAITIFYGFVWVLLSICVFLTGSRAALICVVFSFYIVLYFLLFKKNKIAFFISSAFFIVCFILIMTLPPFETIKKRFISLFTFYSSDSKYEASVSIRFSMLVDSFNMWLKRFLFGYGDGGFAMFTNHNSYSHSTLAELICNFGLVGSFCFLFPMISCMLSKKSEPAKEMKIVFFGMFVIGLIGTVLLQKKAFYIVLALVVSNYIQNSDDRILSFHFNSTNKNFLLAFEKFELVSPGVIK